MITFQSLKKDYHEFKKELYTLKSLDYVIILIIPLLMLLVWILFKENNLFLRLNAHDPKWWSVYTSIFTHLNFNHLFNNLINYIMIVLMQILFIKIIGKRIQYRNMIILTLLTFPVVSSILQIVLKYAGSTMGTSGIVSAFIGFMPYIYLKYYYKKSVNHNVGLLGLALILFIIAIKYDLTSYYTLITLIFMCYLLFISKKEIKKIIKCLLAEKNFFISCILMFIPPFFIILVYSMFPTNIVLPNNLRVDVFSHLIGMIYGFFVSIIYFSDISAAQLWRRAKNWLFLIFF